MVFHNNFAFINDRDWPVKKNKKKGIHGCCLKKGTVVACLEQLGYGAEDRRKVVTSNSGF